MADIGIKRTVLHDKIPLSAPLALQVTPTGKCNFKCKFCHQSLPQHKLAEFIVKKEFMSINMFTKIINDLDKFDQKIKTLVLGGVGEPLLHPLIDQMVKISTREVEQTEIVTNAYLLTPALSDKLQFHPINLKKESE